MRVQPPADEVRPYLELGLACNGEGDSAALVRLLAAQGFWDFGFGIEPTDDSGDRARAVSQRAREVAQRLGRPDLELVALDSISAVLNIRGHYGYAEPIDRERVEITRLVREPFEISDTYYTAGWSALEVGNYRVVVALAAEFEALNVDLPPLGQLANSVIARLPLGDWDEALAEQARLRELFGDASDPAPELRERRSRSRGAHPRAPR